MNIIVIWQSLVVSSYRSFWIHLAKFLGGSVTAVVPHEFWELGGQTVTCAPFSSDWQKHIDSHVLKVRCPHIQAVWFHGLARVFRMVGKRSQSGMQTANKTFLVALMEPYSLSAFFVYVLSVLFLPRQTQILFFSLQNIYKKFPLPLRLVQRFIFSRSTHLLALSDEVTAVLRRQGYQGEVIRFPLWADSSLFNLSERPTQTTVQTGRVRVGFCGAVTVSKGVTDLLEALEAMSPDVLSAIHFEFAGGGPLLEEVRRRLGALEERGLTVRLHGPVPAVQLPEFFNQLDILVVPSRTEAHWKEQFGRVIVEAWACGATVIGSNSGEIPVLLAEPQLVFAERNPAQLQATLKRALNFEHCSALRMSNAERAKPFLDINVAQNFATVLRALS